MKSKLENFGNLEENVSLKNYNTYKVNSSTKYLLHPTDIDSLVRFLKYAKDNKIEFMVLGNGSNVILSDTMYPSVIIKLDLFNEILYEDDKVIAGAGVMMPLLCRDIIRHGYEGLEWASGLPGTVGGSVFGNAEAYKTSTFHYLEEVTYLDYDGNIYTKKSGEISHDYRTSFFKENPYYIIVRAVFRFPLGDEEKSNLLIKDRYERRVASQPLDYPSAGSVFRNISPDLPSGKIIDDLGLKGKRIGDAMISTKHANFIINVGEAKGKDIVKLIDFIRQEVKEKTGYDLILEQEYKRW